MKYVIDATDKRLGRVASEASVLLMGKNRPSFVRNAYPKDIVVEIKNCSKSVISKKKMRDTKYVSFSGYPGGKKVLSMEQVAAKKGYAELFRIAVKGMLPKNKLQPRMMKNLRVME